MKINKSALGGWLFFVIIISFICFLAYPLKAKSETLDILVGGWSKHLNNDFEYNETHKLIGMEYNTFNVGRYKNSYNKTSVFIGKRFSFIKNSYFDLNTNLVAISGYSDYHPSPILLVPTLTFGLKKVKFDAILIPTEVVSLNLRFPYEFR